MQIFLVDYFLPLVIMVVMIVTGLAWLTRLGLYFGFRYRDWRKGRLNPYEKKETMGLLFISGMIFLHSVPLPTWINGERT